MRGKANMRNVAHERMKVRVKTDSVDGHKFREFYRGRGKRSIILMDANWFPPGTIIEVRLPEKGGEKA